MFAPTIPGLLEEKKDRGLPATKDIRDTVHRIENSPWIPETYGKTVMTKVRVHSNSKAPKGRWRRCSKRSVGHVDNIPLETAIVNLSQTSGVNIVADKSIAALTNVLSREF